MPQTWDAVAGTVQFTAPLNVSAFLERVSPDAEVLDLGCGYGRVTSQLAAAGFKNIRGYDASEKMIERAKTQHPQLRFAVADAAKFPEPDRSIEAVVASALLTSIPKPAGQDELRGLFAPFTGWISWRASVPSLSGNPSPVLQFVAYAA